MREAQPSCHLFSYCTNFLADLSGVYRLGWGVGVISRAILD